MNRKFIAFLESLRDNNNADVIDSVVRGYNVITESYADVVDVDRVDTMGMFSRAAAMTAMNNGMPVLQFLQNSADQLKGMYSFDAESQLDNNPTWEYQNWWEKTAKQEEKRWEKNIGLTAEELSGQTDWSDI